MLNAKYIMEKSNYEQLSPEKIKEFEEDHLTVDQRKEGAIREKEHDLAGVSAELVAKCNLRFEKDNVPYLISGEIDGCEVELQCKEYKNPDGKTISYFGTVNGVIVDPEKAEKLYQKYRDIAYMQSGRLLEKAKWEVSKESSNEIVEELLNL